MNGNPEEVQGLPIPPGCGSHPHYVAKSLAQRRAELVGSTPDYGIEAPPPVVDNSLPERDPDPESEVDNDLPEEPVAEPK